MKILLILTLGFLSLTSCVKTYSHKINYSVNVTYFNGDVDTLNGTFTSRGEEYKESPFSMGLSDDACVVLRNSIFTVKRLACGVRNFTILSDSTTVTEEK